MVDYIVVHVLLNSIFVILFIALVIGWVGFRMNIKYSYFLLLISSLTEYFL
jgi:hypothetical protein